MNCQDNGNYYGEILNGLRDGLGQYVPKEYYYDGCWKTDKYHGKGTLYQKEKLIYEGSFKNGENMYLNNPFDYKDFTKVDQQFILWGDFKDQEFCIFRQKKVKCIMGYGLLVIRI